MKFSVIISLRRIGDGLREAMPHLLAQTYSDFEIIIVSEAEEKGSFPKTRIIPAGRASPSRKRNVGAANARGDILAFIDDDAYPARDWLEKAAESLQREPDIAALGGPGLLPPTSTFFQKVSSRVYVLSSRKTGMRYSRRVRTNVDDWPTCNLFVRREVFREMGGFEARHWGGEDTQFCYDMVKAGKRIVYDPDVVVYHYPRERLGEHLRQTFFWAMWRGFLIKSYPQSFQMVFLIPPLFVLWLVAGGFLSILHSAFHTAYAASLAVYGLYLVFVGGRSRSFRLCVPVALVMSLSQLSYGMGFWRGLVLRHQPSEKTFNPAEGLDLHQVTDEKAAEGPPPE